MNGAALPSTPRISFWVCGSCWIVIIHCQSKPGPYPMCPQYPKGKTHNPFGCSTIIRTSHHRTYPDNTTVRGLPANNSGVIKLRFCSELLYVQVHSFPARHSHLPSTLEERKTHLGTWVIPSFLPTGIVGFNHTHEE